MQRPAADRPRHGSFTHEQWAVLTYRVDIDHLYMVIPDATLLQQVFWDTRLWARLAVGLITDNYHYAHNEMLSSLGPALSQPYIWTYNRARLLAMDIAAGTGTLADVEDFTQDTDDLKDKGKHVTWLLGALRFTAGVWSQLSLVLQIINRLWQLRRLHRTDAFALIKHGKLEYSHDTVTVIHIDNHATGMVNTDIFGAMNNDEFMAYFSALRSEDATNLLELDDEQLQMIQMQYTIRTAVPRSAVCTQLSHNDHVAKMVADAQVRYREIHQIMTDIRDHKMVLKRSILDATHDEEMRRIQHNAVELSATPAVVREDEDEEDAAMWALLDGNDVDDMDDDDND